MNPIEPKRLSEETPFTLTDDQIRGIKTFAQDCRPEEKRFAAATVLGLIEKIAALEQERDRLRVSNLKWAIGVTTNNTDIVDMMRDEFQRIIALMPNEEIVGICVRARAIIEQTFPVIVQRDEAEYKLTEAHAAIEKRNILLSVAQCPNCDGSGAKQISDTDCEQCQWCYERTLATTPTKL